VHARANRQTPLPGLRRWPKENLDSEDLSSDFNLLTWTSRLTETSAPSRRGKDLCSAKARCRASLAFRDDIPTSHHDRDGPDGLPGPCSNSTVVAVSHVARGLIAREIEAVDLGHRSPCRQSSLKVSDLCLPVQRRCASCPVWRANWPATGLRPTVFRPRP
jgi:hypothetical protein